MPFEINGLLGSNRPPRFTPPRRPFISVMDTSSVLVMDFMIRFRESVRVVQFAKESRSFVRSFVRSVVFSGE